MTGERVLIGLLTLVALAVGFFILSLGEENRGQAASPSYATIPRLVETAKKETALPPEPPVPKDTILDQPVWKEYCFKHYRFCAEVPTAGGAAYQMLHIGRQGRVCFNKDPRGCKDWPYFSAAVFPSPGYSNLTRRAAFRKLRQYRDDFVPWTLNGHKVVHLRYGVSDYIQIWHRGTLYTINAGPAGGHGNKSYKWRFLRSFRFFVPS